MAHFELYGSCKASQPGRNLDDLKEMLKKSLSNYYNEIAITKTPEGLKVDGNLKGLFERAVTKAEVQINLQQGNMLYQVRGTASLGKWPWVWCILGFFTGFFFFLFGIDLVEYIISRDRPRRYFEEAFKAVEFELKRPLPNGPDRISKTTLSLSQN
jgi:hypothetical protein